MSTQAAQAAQKIIAKQLSEHATTPEGHDVYISVQAIEVNPKGKHSKDRDELVFIRGTRTGSKPFSRQKANNIGVRLGLAKAVLEMSPDDFDLSLKLFNNVKETRHSDKLTQFFVDVQSVASGVDRVQDQYKIYNERMTEFITANEVYSQKEAYQALKDTSDSSASRTLAKLINDNKIFSITLKGKNVGYPAFQFNLKTGKPKPIIKKILIALSGKYKDWDLALWFDSYFDEIEDTALNAINNNKLTSTLIELADNEVGDYSS